MNRSGLYTIDDLTMAASDGDVEKVNQILDEHPELIDQIHSKGTALHCAIGRGRTNVIEVLLERNADISVIMDGFTPLTCAIEMLLEADSQLPVDGRLMYLTNLDCPL